MMTSKEALGILYSKADTTNECWNCRCIIEKDLELLEIIKNNIYGVEINYGSKYQSVNGIQFIVNVLEDKEFIDEDGLEQVPCCELKGESDFQKILKMVCDIKR